MLSCILEISGDAAYVYAVHHVGFFVFLRLLGQKHLGSHIVAIDNIEDVVMPLLMYLSVGKERQIFRRSEYTRCRV